MTKPNVTLQSEKLQAENLIAEIKAFLALAKITPVSLKEAGDLLEKIERWELAK